MYQNLHYKKNNMTPNEIKTALTAEADAIIAQFSPIFSALFSILFYNYVIKPTKGNEP